MFVDIVVIMMDQKEVICYGSKTSGEKNIKKNIKKKEMNSCRHVNQIKDVTPSANGCEECLKIRDKWVHLRLCLSCGHVGCCDSSKNKHATKHFKKTDHPIIKSHELGENWKWCYVDEIGWD